MTQSTEAAQPRAIVVQDISCVGRCSLTVALPVLSAAGVNTAVVPTALLSTHTGEFTGYTHLDLSGQLLPIARHIETLGLHFDAFYSGYLASGAQVEMVLEMIGLLCDGDTHLFVDPAFGDHGRLYSLLDSGLPAQMRRLCARARTITPNLTEAAFLLDEPYPGDTPEEAAVARLCRGLRDLGPENVVVTDVAARPGLTGAAVLARGMDEPLFLYRERYEGLFHGTGDVLASLLLGGLMRGKSLPDAAALALDLTHQALRLTLAGGEPLRYGLRFEQVLPEYWERLGRQGE